MVAPSNDHPKGSGYLHQILLMSWKNWILKKRSGFIAVAIEICLPVIIALIIYAMTTISGAVIHTQSCMSTYFYILIIYFRS